ncbi:nuclear transport factor 2 family protein [Streptomyces iconiensis]|uniref:Nuclear transport factor 2 family protein n=1 Tax=Streptomyces iconiensis TaxID=1384038 RepID=A0ABT6ZNR3_9ACTN|nr:nuclear transport factor 2 family protein [Streptomyces iconiensis]MDJ1130686.1 nuclear transport factor 2 family protein [Streptomyces iconiensis]
MPKQNVDTVKRLYEGLTAFDIDMVLGTCDPEVVIIAPKSLPWSQGDYAGIDGAAAYFASALGHLDQAKFDVEELLPSGDWVTALGWWSGRFKETGNEFNVRFVHFWIIRNGKVVKAEGVSDTVPIARAAEAGLAPAAS